MAPAKPPRPPTPSGRRVEATASRIRATARSPASTSTPAARYPSRRAAARIPEGTPPPPSAMGTDAFLEDELAAGGVVWDGLGIPAVEAGEAEPVVRQVERREDAANREVAQRVGPDEVADLVDRMRRGDQLGLDLGVDPVEAGMEDRRRADPNVDLRRPRAAEQLDDRARGRPADDRVVNDDEALATDDLAKRRQLPVSYTHLRAHETRHDLV